jgi:hypothetical protein
LQMLFTARGEGIQLTHGKIAQSPDRRETLRLDALVPGLQTDAHRIC